MLKKSLLGAVALGMAVVGYSAAAQTVLKVQTSSAAGSFSILPGSRSSGDGVSVQSELP